MTLEIPEIVHKEQETFEKIILVLADEISRLVSLKEKDPVLVVGLGNWHITADALGPKVASSLLVTRHMFELMPEEIESGIRPVCALAPGVLGLTGIETSEIIKGVAERVKPSLIIAIDALAARRLSRISTTIQLTDTGFSPARGGKPRQGLTLDEFGIPLLPLGATVVDAAAWQRHHRPNYRYLASQTGQDTKF